MSRGVRRATNEKISFSIVNQQERPYFKAKIITFCGKKRLARFFIRYILEIFFGKINRYT